MKCLVKIIFCNCYIETSILPSKLEADDCELPGRLHRAAVNDKSGNSDEMTYGEFIRSPGKMEKVRTGWGHA